jgi:DNA-binding HxlR family transcriptional regulator
MKVKPNATALSVALEAVSDRWSLTVVRHLAFGPRRFTDLATLTGAPRDVLTTRLRALEDDGLLLRRPYGSGKREQYELTPKGLDLAEVVLVLKKWGDRYRPSSLDRVALVHTVCGQPFEAEIHCAACGRPLGPDELTEVGSGPARPESSSR